MKKSTKILTKNEQLINELQNKYTKTIKKINSENTEFEYVKVALIEAEQIWINTQILMQTEDYKTMSDTDKISLIQRDFAEFYKNFPIVARYMICLGQYRMPAFRRMLIRCNETKAPEGEKNTKDMNEKLWVDRQADYIRFLWEDYQDGNSFTAKDSDDIWTQTHVLLTEEFQQFKDLHEDAEKKIKSDAAKHKKELLYEMSSRLVNGQQVLSDAAAITLLDKLKSKLYKQRFNTVVSGITSTSQTPAVCESIGTNADAKDIYEQELKQSFCKKNYKKMDLEKILQK